MSNDWRLCRPPGYLKKIKSLLPSTAADGYRNLVFLGQRKLAKCLRGIRCIPGNFRFDGPLRSCHELRMKRRVVRRLCVNNLLLVLTISSVFIGLILGFILRPFNLSDEACLLINFPGEIFLQVLKMMILPLIFSSLISALAQMDASESGQMGITLLYLIRGAELRMKRRVVRRLCVNNLLLVLTISSVFIGLILGFILRPFNLSDEACLLINFPGEIFLQVLKMMILPLIFSSLISALAQMDASESGQMGITTVVYYIVTAALSTIVSLFSSLNSS
uniref:Amino acid transporter n=1 Tax=Ascaris lumbricoides TaxID=6252 RepID=A0A0M3IN22_ASCLU